MSPSLTDLNPVIFKLLRCLAKNKTPVQSSELKELFQKSIRNAPFFAPQDAEYEVHVMPRVIVKMQLRWRSKNNHKKPK